MRRGRVTVNAKGVASGSGQLGAGGPQVRPRSKVNTVKCGNWLLVMLLLMLM